MNVFVLSEEFCYYVGIYNGVIVGVCLDCFGCWLKDCEECKFLCYIMRIVMIVMDIEIIVEGVFVVEKVYVWFVVV